MEIVFRLNGEIVRTTAGTTETLLDWLRERRGLTGTKEGCNEGDCGACTVMVRRTPGSGAAAVALNACILFMPQLHGASVRTVEGIAAPDGTLHPVQTAMIDHHGSQCGFCTPGVVVSMATAHLNGRTDHDDQLGGNLCRCTGYAPIVRAAKAAGGAPVPGWFAPDDAGFDTGSDAGPNTGDHTGDHMGGNPVSGTPFVATSADALAAWYADHPDGTLIAGATDVGLWVTKQFRDLGAVCFIAGAADLAQIDRRDGMLHVGAAVTMTALGEAVAADLPAYAEVIRRYGSVQVRNAATLGGSLANGSPIGDNAPVLIALGATLQLRRGDVRRTVPLEDFFVAYGRQDRQPGEFVEAVSFAARAPGLRAWKISKRFDQDISAVCGAFDLDIKDGIVTRARIAFGGMAGTPCRAKRTEAALAGERWTEDTVRAATAAMSDDFSPLSDMRASAGYRLQTAQNLLWRYWAADQGSATNVLEVHA